VGGGGWWGGGVRLTKKDLSYRKRRIFKVIWRDQKKEGVGNSQRQGQFSLSGAPGTFFKFPLKKKHEGGKGK